MSELMNAGCASADGLVLKRVPVPTPGPDQLLVKVRAAGINRADLVAAKGAYSVSKDAADAPIGMEWAGEIVAVGANAGPFAEGDFVTCSGSGGYADYAVADKGRAIKFDPRRIPIEQAAVLPLALMTAHNALVTVGAMRRGDTVLVHGASSAVGLTAIRIAKLLGAGLVAGTSSNAAKGGRLSEFGADIAIDSSQDSWSAAFKEANGGQGADVIIDMVTGPHFSETMKAAALLGRIVNVGRLGGASTDFDLNLHALNRLAFLGVTFRTRSLTEVRQIATTMKRDLWSFVESGELSLPIDRSFPLARADEALAVMASNDHFGKLLLVP